jgi:hypothetical protein
MRAVGNVVTHEIEEGDSGEPCNTCEGLRCDTVCVARVTLSSFFSITDNGLGSPARSAAQVHE